ncbi:hypothetical protein DS837_11775 [Azospirillum brasilense]|uniref:Uncharacterized protein n=1 Tax=Azospirillum brasilense TaxID=192 RepID=A0A6L3B159_AZOBR|nr:hypothetical protein DS837_11775 [Azospirillum brasilense]
MGMKDRCVCGMTGAPSLTISLWNRSTGTKSGPSHIGALHPVVIPAASTGAVRRTEGQPS